MKILLIEDEKALRESIESYFKEEGNLCEIAIDYWSALNKINLYQYDCILLDLTLPGGDGLEILAELKKKNRQEGILIISAKNALDDKLNGLDLGADDYLVKPFHLSELKSRVMAIVRRKSFSGNNILQFKDLKIDTMAMEARSNDKLINFTKKEYDLLLYFIANQGKVITKNAIAEHLWGDGIDMSDDFDFIYTHIKNLRKKLDEVGAKDYISSMYGVGYKMHSI